MDPPDVEICNGDAISIFLGKCVEVDGYQFCPRVPEFVRQDIDIDTEIEHHHYPEEEQ